MGEDSSMVEGEKQHAHELIERLSEPDLATVVRFLEFMLLDPVARALVTAPADDEPATEQDRERLRAGQAWFSQRGGKGIHMEDVLAEFGVNAEDLPSTPQNGQ